MTLLIKYVIPLKKNKMKYSIWETRDFGGCDVMPMCKLTEKNTLKEAFLIYDEMAQISDIAYIVFNEETNKIIIDGREFIYDSPDKGDTIYVRRFLSDKRVQIIE